MAKTKIRLDEILMQRGLCSTSHEAQALIIAGKVSVNGVPTTKPGSPTDTVANVVVKRPNSRFATRGGYKLEKALRVFSVDVSDRVALDAGAAAGGFTDCMLQRGARQVYAVDVGYGQMKGRLAADSRVVNLEKTNISDLSQRTFQEPISFCAVDLSYLTLVKAVPIVCGLFTHPYEVICLIKPLFEGLPQQSKSDPAELRLTLTQLFNALASEGYGACDVTSSPTLGTHESVEFLCLIREQSPSADPDFLTMKALEAMRTEPPVTVDAMPQ